MDAIVDYQNLQQSIEQAIAEFHDQGDVNRLILQVRKILFSFIEALIVLTIQQLLNDPDFLKTMKVLAAKSALRFKGFKPTSIRLLSGQSFSIKSPYFTKTAAKARRGRKSKKRKAKTGVHLGLSYMGFIDRTSFVLASSAVQAALLSPSYEIAQRTLHSSGIELNIKTISRLCLEMGNQAIEHRNRIAVSDMDKADSRMLFVCIDGGRLRERTPKRGRRPSGQKRQGYHTDWREPTQIVIQWLNSDGGKCDKSPPLYDATLADTDAAFDLLEGYLRQIDISKADTVIFGADGARKYWKRFSALASKLELKAHFEVIDYTHAKQNLQEVADHLPEKLEAKKRSAIIKDWKNLLWQGKLADIHSQIQEFIKLPRKRKQALKKFKGYFLENFSRMKYAAFRLLNLPTGTGCVESAIRRVINLRLKSPGIFWKRETAEVMLFLRSTLLCGRWNIMLNNLQAINRGQLA